MTQSLDEEYSADNGSGHEGTWASQSWRTTTVAVPVATAGVHRAGVARRLPRRAALVAARAHAAGGGERAHRPGVDRPRAGSDAAPAGGRGRLGAGGARWSRAGRPAAPRRRPPGGRAASVFARRVGAVRRPRDRRGAGSRGRAAARRHRRLRPARGRPLAGARTTAAPRHRRVGGPAAPSRPDLRARRVALCGAGMHVTAEPARPPSPVSLSRGGNARGNRITVCVWHHLHGLHGGRVRAWGRAPARVHWEVGVDSGRGALLRTWGDRYVVSAGDGDGTLGSYRSASPEQRSSRPALPAAARRSPASAPASSTTGSSGGSDSRRPPRCRRGGAARHR
jgi:hypothetical protein